MGNLNAELVCKIVHVESGDLTSYVMGKMIMPRDRKSFDFFISELAERSSYANFYCGCFEDREDVVGYDADRSADAGCPNVPSFRMSRDDLLYDIDLVYAVNIRGYWCELPIIFGIED